MKSVPFYANTKDDTHCFQAALRMVLKYFLPQRNFSYKQLDEMTDHRRNLWAWPMKGTLALEAMNFDIVDIEQFDYSKAALDTEQYLINVYGEDVAREQIQHSDIPIVQKEAQEFSKKIRVDYRIPTFDDIQKLLNNGYLVICLVNSKTMNGKRGYIGHFVVIFACTNDAVMLHDPGLPPKENRLVEREVFERAWGYPDDRVKNVIAFKL